MSKRGVTRIDYRLLHSAGVVSPQVVEENLSQELNNMSLHDNQNELKDEMTLIIEEIKDTIDENCFSHLTTPEIDTIIEKLEKSRQDLRRKHLQIGATDLPMNDAINSIKEYIISARDFKLKARLREDKMKQETIVQNERSATFLIEHVCRQIEDLEDMFGSNVENTDVEELLRWRTDLPSHVKKFDKIAESYKEVLKTPITNAEMLVNIRTVGEQFEKLSKLKRKFTQSLNNEIENKEDSKKRNSTSNLNHFLVMIQNLISTHFA